jgi:hypothetical protein
MKTRIFSIMDTTKKKAGITVLCIALITTIGAGIVFATGSQRMNRLTKQQALLWMIIQNF